MLKKIESLLAPISPESPAGENLEFEPIFDEIRSARESDPDYLQQDEWSVSEPRKADWNRVRTLSENALIEQSKDLQLASWFVEALLYQQGLMGLIAGVDFLSEFITRFWFQCWPSLDDEGINIRRGRLQRLDRDLSQQLCRLALLHQPNTTLAYWRQLLANEHRINTSSSDRAEESDISLASFIQRATDFSSIEISQQADRVEQLTTTFGLLESRYISLSQDSEGNVFMQTRQTLADITDYLQRLAQYAIPVTDETISFVSFDDNNTPPQRNNPIQTMNREIAISQMLAIASYFRLTEPSSPVSFLMERAARWANMNLTEWLEEMLNDGTINEINNVLTGHSR
ncbi:type VI secretion system protein TssA [Enterobacteriaceae bacterium RIT711]|nr:type VI secretion system protein TssA [Enterobacteriaceae bacterium RIT711]